MLATATKAIQPCQTLQQRREAREFALCRSRKALRPCAALEQQSAPLEPAGLDRRTFLGLAAALAASRTQGALAEEGMNTYFGLATPPTSYGGYGGNDPNASPKYQFDYPAGWKADVINKTDKGTQGIDCRLYNPRNKQQQVFVITFSRAGEDNKSFKLLDIDSTIAGFAGADYDMQDALGIGEKRTSQREIEGQVFYDIEIDSPDVQYLSTVTVNQGKVYACFVKSPTRLFKEDEARLRAIVASFRTLSPEMRISSP